MTLVAEYAVTPDVLDATAYASEEICGLHLRILKKVLLEEGLVRDLRAGEWRAVFADENRAWHRWGRELLRKLAKQNRLVRDQPARPDRPIDDAGWCEEALTSHARRALSGGVIVGDALAAAYPQAIVSGVSKLPAAPWWTGRSSSVRLQRTTASYGAALDPVLRHANSIMLIDPHIDPSLARYAAVAELLAALDGRASKPLVEIHRVCYVGPPRDRDIPSKDQWEARFRGAMELGLRQAGAEVAVFVWDDFHDRYVISDLVGIDVPRGFDTSADEASVTTWTRIARTARDDIQREFDPGSGRHELRYQFTIP